MKTEIVFALKNNANFIIKSIKEICRIEKQTPEKNSFLFTMTKKAIERQEILIARVDNKIIGFLQFSFSDKEPYGLNYGKRKNYCWIEWMFIERRYRRKKIGSNILNFLNKICKKKGIREIMLDCFKVNGAARKFYNSRGFNDFVSILRKKI